MKKKFSVSVKKKIEKFNKKIKIPGDKSCSIRAILLPVNVLVYQK